ncbi:MAG: hypothetical protein ACK559_33055, partial [bacterium]
MSRQNHLKCRRYAVGSWLAVLLAVSACASESPRVYTDGYGYSEKERGTPAARGLSNNGPVYT